METEKQKKKVYEVKRNSKVGSTDLKKRKETKKVGKKENGGVSRRSVAFYRKIRQGRRESAADS